MQNKTIAIWLTVLNIFTWLAMTGENYSVIGMSFIAFSVFGFIAAYKLNK